jgi:hypothetical protein
MLGVIPFDQVAQPRLVNGNLIRSQHVNLASIDVRTGDVISSFRKAGTYDKADVAGSNDADMHDVSTMNRGPSSSR